MTCKWFVRPVLSVAISVRISNFPSLINLMVVIIFTTLGSFADDIRLISVDCSDKVFSSNVPSDMTVIPKLWAPSVEILFVPGTILKNPDSKWAGLSPT